MSQNAIMGYPRVGSQRELKFWTEDYFRERISAKTLRRNAAGLRKKQWLIQKHNGIDFIPSNDFSFYDGVLDTACLLNAVPQAYRALDLGELDTYFAMARGYQGEAGDVKALAMRKWFNTNYHYMVPVLGDDTEIRLSGDKPFAEYGEALALGIRTKPVLLGPFTFLMLADYPGRRQKKDFIPSMIEAYTDIVDRFNGLGTEWVQLDEPALVLDLGKEEIELFRSLYTRLLSDRGGLKVLLQTYFGDIRDVYPEVAEFGFDGIGLDFIEGKQSLDLIRSQGFPESALLFAGLVNGKNIWRNEYGKTLGVLHELSEYVPNQRVVISTSCSLLHVPYTLDHEENMDSGIKGHLAFAREKLGELNDLKTLFDDPDYASDERFTANMALMQSKQGHADSAVRAAAEALTERDFTRLPDFGEREKLQRDALHLPILPTTTIGSFPQTREVKALRKKLRRGEISREEYEAGIKDKIAECIDLQEELGLDVLVHGEYERNDMVEYFGENLAGFLFTQKGWVQSYGTRCVKPPIIRGDISRARPITVKYSAYAQSLTDRPVKGMLTGPVTILNWSFPREDISHRDMAYQIALAIREEVKDLEQIGIRIIQIDEAALKEKLPLRRGDWHEDYLEWAIPAFRLVHASVKPETQIHTHMCYSEFQEIVREIDAMDADVISFEASRSNLSIVDALYRADFKTQVGPGVYDIHSPRVPGTGEIADAIQKMLGRIKKEKLWINPDCGLKTRGEEETVPSLSNMVEAARRIRGEMDR